MRKLLILLAAVLVLVPVAQSVVRVRGHFRSNGTYVVPHYRSDPDGLFWNNWSTQGNINPFTGQPGTRVTPPPRYQALQDYYSLSLCPRAMPELPSTRTRPSVTRPWILPSFVDSLPIIADPVADDDVSRSVTYCRCLYAGNRSGEENCVGCQLRALASLVLPDYTSTLPGELERAASYCEWLYGDNRAGFYDCLNSQAFGLAQASANFADLPGEEVARSRKYCEWLYGNNRAGCQECLRQQASQLLQHLGERFGDIPPDEWARSERYCEWLYGDNRGGAAECMAVQAEGLRRHVSLGSLTRFYARERLAHCEWLYGDNRAGFWDCLARP